jgi:hypothetical protein
VDELTSIPAEMPAWTLVLLDTKGIVKNIWVGSMRLGHAPKGELPQRPVPRLHSTMCVEVRRVKL